MTTNAEKKIGEASERQGEKRDESTEKVVGKSGKWRKNNSFFD